MLRLDLYAEGQVEVEVLTHEDRDKLLTIVGEYPSIYCDYVPGQFDIEPAAAWREVARRVGYPEFYCRLEFKQLYDRFKAYCYCRMHNLNPPVLEFPIERFWYVLQSKPPGWTIPL